MKFAMVVELQSMITLTTRLAIFCYLGLRSFKENPEPESVGLPFLCPKRKEKSVLKLMAVYNRRPTGQTRPTRSSLRRHASYVPTVATASFDCATGTCQQVQCKYQYYVINNSTQVVQFLFLICQAEGGKTSSPFHYAMQHG